MNTIVNINNGYKIADIKKFRYIRDGEIFSFETCYDDFRNSDFATHSVRDFIDFLFDGQEKANPVVIFTMSFDEDREYIITPKRFL